MELNFSDGIGEGDELVDALQNPLKLTFIELQALEDGIRDPLRFGTVQIQMVGLKDSLFSGDQARPDLCQSLVPKLRGGVGKAGSSQFHVMSFFANVHSVSSVNIYTNLHQYSINCHFCNFLWQTSCNAFDFYIFEYTLHCFLL